MSPRTVNNGNFRKVYATHVRMQPHDRWINVQHMKPWIRDTRTVRAGWEAARATHGAVQRYDKKPSCAAFRLVYETWNRELRVRLRGCVGEYAYKRCLDVVVAAGFLERAHICRWPANCSGYTVALKKLFPKSHKKDNENLLFTLWRLWPNAQGLSVGEVAMMLCWWSSAKCRTRMLVDEV